MCYNTYNTCRAVNAKRSSYLLYLELSVQQFLSRQFHWELSPGKEHCVSVQSLNRRWFRRLSTAFSWTDTTTAAGTEGESTVKEAVSPLWPPSPFRYRLAYCRNPAQQHWEGRKLCGYVKNKYWRMLGCFCLVTVFRYGVVMFRPSSSVCFSGRDC